MWVSRFGAAEQPPTPEEMERLLRRMSPPDNEIPAGVGLSVLLGRADDVAVGLTQVEAFSMGFRFTLAVRARPTRPPAAPGQLHQMIGSYPVAGADIPLEDRLLVGIEYPDGRRASTLQNMRVPHTLTAADDQRLALVPQGGHGGEYAVDQAYWVTPLPPDGPVTVVIAWPGFGIPETSTVLDGAVIRDAAGRSQTLWPPQPAAEPPPPPPPPPLPSSGWFAEPSA